MESYGFAIALYEETELKGIKGLVPESYPKNKIVLKQGVRSREMFFLISGVVDVIKNGITINRVSKPGAVFGEIAALLNTPHTATVQTVKPCFFLTTHDPDLFFKANPDAGYYIAAMLAERLRDLDDCFVKMQKQCLSQHSNPAQKNCHNIAQIMHRQRDEVPLQKIKKLAAQKKKSASRPKRPKK